MRALAAVCVVLSGCTCFDSAYEQYCITHPCAAGGGSAAGGGVSGGGTGGGGPDAGQGGGSGGGGVAPEDALALTLPATVKATVCTAGTVTLFGGTTHAPMPAAADLAVALDGGGLVTFFDGTDVACVSAPITALTLPAQASSASFNFHATVFGAATVSAQAPAVAAAQEPLTATALARLVATGDTIPAGPGCPVQLTLRIVDVDTKSVPVPALAAGEVRFVPTGATLGFGDSNCMNTVPFNVMLSPGESAVTLYAGSGGSASCGDSATLTASSMNLAPGLILDGSASTLGFFYVKYPALAACTSDPQCCNGACASQQCN